MIAPDTNRWIETNQQALSRELDWLRQLLQRTDTNTVPPTGSSGERSHLLDFLTERFRLSTFERAIVLLCAGVELESEIDALCCKLAGNAEAPGFGLALSLLPEAHWSALSPESPLRYWQLIQLRDPTRLTTTRLTLDERLLHFLLGVGCPDQRLSGLLQPLVQHERLPSSQQRQVERLAGLWTDKPGRLPMIVVRGNDPAGGRAVATGICAGLHLQAFQLSADDIPVGAEDRLLLSRLLTREYLLSGCALVIDAGENPPPQLKAFLELLDCPVLLQGERPYRMLRDSLVVEVNKPSAGEQTLLWDKALEGREGFERSALPPLAAQFDFSSHEISTAVRLLDSEVDQGEPLMQTLWRNCRRQSRDGLDQLAQRIDPRAGWDDLVLPGGQKSILREICRQVRHRATVYETWGFAGKSGRGLGISALFAGESGTGKTMAAEVMAGDLDLDLYRIDLSAVVSKYIGETEKNLERLFRAAESSGAILLFDEADALFGKRSEVKDSHDRYANIELAFLLQRMESYRGLSILTSNLKSSLDNAFLRRIRFIAHFPFPDRKQRGEIWRRVIPEHLPCESLDMERLAQLHATGGNIRNIALNAAFLAAENSTRLGMADLAHAARLEYAKLEKPVNETELGKWI
jgi:hypothetical protein